MPYRVFPDLLPANNLFVIAKWMRAEHDLRPKWEQNGFPLCETPEVFDRLSTLLSVAGDLLGGRCSFAHTHSSCRLQLPSGAGMLGPHQDVVALDHRPGLTFWIPLQDIDESCPTLGVGEDEEDRPHLRDKSGYAVIDDNLVRNFVVLSPLALGTVVSLMPLTVHTTYVPAGATKERLSLDVRIWKE